MNADNSIEEWVAYGIFFMIQQNASNDRSTDRLLQTLLRLNETHPTKDAPIDLHRLSLESRALACLPVQIHVSKEIKTSLIKPSSACPGHIPICSPSFHIRASKPYSPPN